MTASNRVPRRRDQMKKLPTIDELRALGTRFGPRGDRQTLESWGVSWPPQKGWKKQLEAVILERSGTALLKQPPRRPNGKKERAERRAQREASGKKFAPSPNNPKSTKSFYASWEWRTLRLEVLKTFGHRCQACGAAAGDMTVGGSPVRIVVDHIKPISRFWHLRLDRSNLQVLCDECNMGKGAWDQTDYRPEGAVLWGDKWPDSADDRAREAVAR